MELHHDLFFLPEWNWNPVIQSDDGINGNGKWKC